MVGGSGGSELGFVEAGGVAGFGAGGGAAGGGGEGTNCSAGDRLAPGGAGGVSGTGVPGGAWGARLVSGGTGLPCGIPRSEPGIVSGCCSGKFVGMPGAAMAALGGPPSGAGMPEDGVIGGIVDGTAG
jgi:hypothetical protein